MWSIEKRREYNRAYRLARSGSDGAGLRLPGSRFFVRGTPGVCTQCDREYPRLQPLQLTCSKRCFEARRASRRPRSADWANGRQPERVLNCGRCSTPILTRGSYAFCLPCRRDAIRAKDAAKNNRRRGARGRGVYTLGQIGDRDGWRCHLCTRAVDRRLPGSDPLGPTGDHMIPISAGGLDTPLNVRIAHRVCNLRRGAAPLGIAA